jgi:hypothetical protein
VEITPLRFVDANGIHLDGLHLAFLSPARSTRSTTTGSDLSFLGGTRPYVVPLGAPAVPFHPESARSAGRRRR